MLKTLTPKTAHPKSRKPAALDALKAEAAHRRISKAAYQAGLTLQAILESSGDVAGSNWCGTTRLDPARAIDHRIVQSLGRARGIAHIWRRLTDLVGTEALRVVQSALSQPTSLSATALCLGYVGEAHETEFKQMFRRTLEQIAASGILRSDE